MFNHFFIKSKVFVSFLISYLIVLLMLTVLGMYNYFYISKTIEKNAEESIRISLKQIQKVLDERFISIREITTSIAFNKDVNNTLYLGGSQKEDEIYQLSKVADIFQNRILSTDFVEDICLVYKNSDTVVSTMGMFSSEVYYKNRFSYTDLSYAQWKNMLFKTYYNKAVFVKDGRFEKGTKKVLVYMQSLPLGIINEPLGNLAVLINTSKIEDILKGINTSSGGAVFIINSSNEILVVAGDRGIASEYSYNSFKEDGLYKDKINGRNNMIIFEQSEQNDWKYAVAIPTDIFDRPQRIEGGINLAVLMLSLIISIIFAVVFARRNYNPIRDIAENLMEDSAHGLDDAGELSFIQEIIAKMKSDHKETSQTMAKQIPILKNNLLIQLLKGNIDKKHNLYSVLESYGVVFADQYYCVMVMEIEIHKNELNEIDMIKYAIKNVMEEMSNEKFSTYMVDFDLYRMAMIINLDEETLQNISEIDAIGQRINRFMSDNFEVVLTIGVGNIYRYVSKLTDSYNDAVQALNYALFRGAEGVFNYDRTENRLKNYSYPIEAELKLISSVKMGDAVQVNILIDDTFERNFSDTLMSAKMAQCLFFDIMGTAFKVMNEIGLDQADVFGSDFSPHDKLLNASSINDMRLGMIEMFNKICCYISENQKKHSGVLIQQIVDYCKNNYFDINLNLNSISQMFNVNHSYLSHVFKEQTGENFVDFIRGLKTKKAVELLKDKNLTLDDIAVKLGYSNSGVLIRNFKKTKGITPGQFRNNMHIEANGDRND